MKRSKPKPFWIARDGGDGWVIATARKPKLIGAGWDTDALIEIFTPRDFTRLFGVSLRPGEGPIRVTCRVEEVGHGEA